MYLIYSNVCQVCMTFSETCKTGYDQGFQKKALSKCMDFSAHETLIPVLNLTDYNRKCSIDLWYLQRLAGIDCNLNQIAQKIPLVSPSCRKIFLKNKESVLPSWPELTCSGLYKRQVSCPTGSSFSLRKTPFPGREALLLHSGTIGKNAMTHSPVEQGGRGKKGVNHQDC